MLGRFASCCHYQHQFYKSSLTKGSTHIIPARLETMTKNQNHPAPPQSGKCINLPLTFDFTHTHSDITYWYNKNRRDEIHLEIFLERKQNKCMFLAKPQPDQEEIQHLSFSLRSGEAYPCKPSHWDRLRAHGCYQGLDLADDTKNGVS